MKSLVLIASCYLLALFPPFAVEWLCDYSGVYYLYDSRAAYGIDTALIIVLSALGLSCLTHYVGRYQRVLFSIFIALFSLLGVVSTAHVILYGAPISVGAIDALLGTDLHEALEFVSFQSRPALTVTAVGYALLAFVAIKFVRPRLQIQRRDALAHGLAWMSVFVLVLLTYQHPAVALLNRDAVEKLSFFARVDDLNNQVPSLRIIRNVREWFAYREWLLVNQERRASYRFHATLNLKTPRTLVIVLGESLRRENMSLYGYDKPTTPNLDARREQFLIFNRAVSPANQTVPSVTMMLSPATVHDPDRFLTRPSILIAAKEAGYQTYWLSNQGRVGQFDSKISLLAHDAGISVYLNTEFYGTVLDEALLRPLEIALQDPHPYKLIVVHMQGSHQNYESRYPEKFATFTGDQYAHDEQHPELSAEQNAIIAQYDNSILYTDSILGAILTLLDNQPGSMMLFVSDHGERFFEDGVMSAGHGYSLPVKHEFDVPYFIWCNGGCAKSWRDAAKQRRDLVFSTEHSFDTYATMLGLLMPDYQAKADILNKKYQGYAPSVIATEKNVLSYAQLP